MAPKFLGGGLTWGDGLNLPLELAAHFKLYDHSMVDQDIWLRLESKKICFEELLKSLGPLRKSPPVDKGSVF